MAEQTEKLLIDIRELSALTGISVGTLYHWVSERRIPCVKLSQRCLRFSLPAIREWLAELNEPVEMLSRRARLV
jgi:excisionase family DNA binding protein